MAKITKDNYNELKSKDLENNYAKVWQVNEIREELLANSGGGVTSITSGNEGLNIDPDTGDVTITNTGVVSIKDINEDAFSGDITIDLASEIHIFPSAAQAGNIELRRQKIYEILGYFDSGDETLKISYYSGYFRGSTTVPGYAINYNSGERSYKFDLITPFPEPIITYVHITQGISNYFQIPYIETQSNGSFKLYFAHDYGGSLVGTSIQVGNSVETIDLSPAKGRIYLQIKFITI